MIARAKLIYRLLLAVWAVVLVWQVLEHQRVTELARSAVIRRARDITSTLGLVIHSQRRFGAIVSKPRLESALKEVLKADDLKSVALLNATGDVLVSAGELMDFGTRGMPQSGVHWDKKTVTVVNLVDLGADLQADGTNASPTIVLPDPGPRGRDDRNRRPPGPWPRRDGDTNAPGGTNSRAALEPPPPPEGTNRPPGFDRPPDFDRPGGRAGFRRPPWMTEEEYKSLSAEKGLHGLAIVLSTESFQAARTQDMWLRLMIAGFASVSVVGLGFAWRTQAKSGELQMRLVRASETNSHLRDMNVAAAGLAHETRNPLNIIRGLAQMISKAPDASEETRKKSLEITDEVDRVTVQLNEFINYSKPREVRRSPVVLGTVVGEVVRALKSDLEDKGLELALQEVNLTINADQQLLRQVLFNLLMNAIQAVAPHGHIQIVTRKTSAQEASFEICDDGPGVPAAQRKEIFRPYFTTREQGTGLGLAVVKQIVVVHGWEVDCLPNEPRGAIFRVSRIELLSTSGS